MSKASVELRSCLKRRDDESGCQHAKRRKLTISRAADVMEAYERFVDCIDLMDTDSATVTLRRAAWKLRKEITEKLVKMGL